MVGMKADVIIGRSPEEVFAYLKDPKNNLNWESNVVEMEITSEGPVGVGTKGRRVEKIMGTDESIWEVTEFEENKTLTFAFESPKFEGAGGYQLSASNGGTRLGFWLRGEPRSLFGKLMMLAFTPMIRRQVRRDYARLKQLLESGA